MNDEDDAPALSDPVIYLSQLLNAHDRSDTIVRFECLSESIPLNVEIERAVLPKFAALALLLASPHPNPKLPQERAVGLAPDSVELDRTDGGNMYLGFGIAGGVVRFHLDRAQLAELRLLLERAAR